jgi:hypothetical protein
MKRLNQQKFKPDEWDRIYAAVNREAVGVGHSPHERKTQLLLRKIKRASSRGVEPNQGHWWTVVFIKPDLTVVNAQVKSATLLPVVAVWRACAVVRAQAKDPNLNTADLIPVGIFKGKHRNYHSLWLTRTTEAATTQGHL